MEQGWIVNGSSGLQEGFRGSRIEEKEAGVV